MNPESQTPDDRLDALFRAARQARPDVGPGYGFETRLLARIREQHRNSFLGLAFRLSPIFAALVVAAAAWFHSAIGMEADATYAWDAVRSGAAPVVEAWLNPEATR